MESLEALSAQLEGVAAGRHEESEAPTPAGGERVGVRLRGPDNDGDPDNEGPANKEEVGAPEDDGNMTLEKEESFDVVEHADAREGEDADATVEPRETGVDSVAQTTSGSTISEAVDESTTATAGIDTETGKRTRVVFKEPDQLSLPESHEPKDSPPSQTQEQPQTTEFPQLTLSLAPSPDSDEIDGAGGNRRTDGISHMLDDDEEPPVAKVFDRSASPAVGLGIRSSRHVSRSSRSRGLSGGAASIATGRKSAEYEKVGEEGPSRMAKFSLYETATRYYMVGSDITDERFRILKIDRTAETGDLSISEDEIVYTKDEMTQLLDTVDDGNKSTGGLKLRCSTWGLLGFIRFTGAYYMLLITKRNQIAMLGGHYIYQVEGTELVPLTAGSSHSSRFKLDNLKDPEEARFISILHNLDLTRSFYFSTSYDITRTLQHNMCAERVALANGTQRQLFEDHNSMFVWNDFLLRPARDALKNTYDWCRPIIHGYVRQSQLSVYGRSVYITIIARRSRFFAGARFLKRGANDLGQVANDVETEQIVNDMLTTSFHAPGPTLFSNPRFTSYVQHRGSIPLYWSQENTGVTPKPDINMNLVDPFYSAAALHFDDLFERYGAPVYVLNLVKARERTERESKLLREFTTAIEYLNQSLPEDKKIIYKAWDMSRASKSRDQDVIGTLEAIAAEIIPTTGFFQNGDDAEGGLQLQNGVARTNCIDCLDRTNAAQFVIGKRALGHQLHALGVTDGFNVEYDSDAVMLFTEIWHQHGDTIAIQYGGSHLVNTMATYRKINQWSSQSRDMVESFKRYYNNSFLDAQRQEAYNLFLGNYVFVKGQPMLWDLATDYYLHHANPRFWSVQRKYTYINWFTPKYLEPRPLPPKITARALEGHPLEYLDDYWQEYYRQRVLSSMKRLFVINLHSTLNYLPMKSVTEGKHDLSPFVVRVKLPEPQVVESRSTAATADPPRPPTRRKGVTIVEPSAEERGGNDYHSFEGLSAAHTSHARPSTPQSHSAPLQAWLDQSSQQAAADGLHNPTMSPHSRQNRPVSHHSHLPPGPSIMREPTLSFPESLLSSQTTLPTIANNQSTLSTTNPTASDQTQQPPSKAQIAQWTLNQLVTDSLNPEVTPGETDEYTRYINHPLQVPLVLSATEPKNRHEADSTVAAEFWQYVNSASAVLEGGMSAVSTSSIPSTPGPRPHSSSIGSTKSTASSTAGTAATTPSSLMTPYGVSQDALSEYEEFLLVDDNALSVGDDDWGKKRYKRYRQWLRGKSLFKQRVEA